MTKVMIALAMLMLGVLTLGMSQQAVAEDAVAIYERGLDCLWGRNGVEKDPQQAVSSFRRLAESGWPIAQHRLGEIYHQGQGVPQSRVKAYVWYQRAAAQDFPPARIKLVELTQQMSNRELKEARRNHAGLAVEDGNS